MEFVILFASQGRYLSRNLQQVIKNIIGRAIEAVAASHIDPYRYTIDNETNPLNHNPPHFSAIETDNTSKLINVKKILNLQCTTRG